MLAAIVDFSIRFRGLIVGLAIVTTAYGVLRLTRAGLDIFPEFSPKAVIVQTEAPGMSAEQVEVLVSQVVGNAMTGLIALDHVRSESIQGLSIVTVVFADDTDVYRNRQFVVERLSAISSYLPATVRAPVAVPLTSSSATVRTIGIQSRTVELVELRALVDTTIVPRLLSVPGVADVNVFGGAARSIQIQPDLAALEAHELSMNDVVAATQRVTGVTSLGFLENANQRLSLTIDKLPQSQAELKNVIVRQDARGTILLDDVASIVVAAEPESGAAQIGGEAAIVMMVIGQYGANTLTVSNRLHDVLEDFEANLAKRGITLSSELFVPANYIEASLANISEHIFLGGCFVLVVLVLFLFDARAAFISAVAIPLSLLGAVIFLLMMGVNLNIMVLGGLAIALGEVVDDAIIDTENIYRRLRENRSSGAKRGIAAVVFDASMEVRGSVVYASFIVVLVFVPLLTLSGVAGRLFAPLGVTYILAVLSSLIVALTVTPALCCLLIGDREIRAADPPLIRLCKPYYATILRAIGRFSAVPIIAVVATCVAVGATLPTFGAQFLPPLREGHYIVHTTGLPGTSLAESIRVGALLTDEFLQIPGVRSVSQWAGRAERGADTYGSHYSEYEVSLEPLSGAEQGRVLDALRRVLDAYPGLLFEANTFLTERVDETISGYTAAIVVNIFGKNLDELDRKAFEVMQLMKSMKGAAAVQMRAVSSTPSAQIVLDWGRIDHFGVRVQDIVDTIAAAYGGAIVGRAVEDNRIANVMVILGERDRRDIESIRSLPLKTIGGEMIRVGDVVDITQITGRYNVLHRSGQRLQAVTGNVDGGDVTTFMNELRVRIADEISVPSDMHIEFAGSAIEQARAREDLIAHSLLAAIGVMMLVYVAVGRLRNVLLIAVNLPFALVGGVVAVTLTNATLSIGSVVGFVTLFGITVRNSIMLVSHYQYLVEVDGQSWSVETAIRGAQERFPSITMTALVTALAMLPIAFDSDNAGREIMGPMATIVIGGFISTALLNLLIMPSMMLHFGQFGSAARDHSR
ncbi:MAG: efflux RND transporter permease subunit [Gammaproteobacteria bacterium]|nr:efflux RND transporter permease subunit [Gammaproteobacteria bacterium]